jgi:hypothetical protein
VRRRRRDDRRSRITPVAALLGVIEIAAIYGIACRAGKDILMTISSEIRIRKHQILGRRRQAAGEKARVVVGFATAKRREPL